MADANQLSTETHRDFLDQTHHPNNLIMGAIAGLIATIPMSCMLGTIDTSADDEIMTNLVRRTGYPLDADGRQLAMFVSRFGFGAGSGLLFATFRKRMRRVPPELRGPAFALGLWALTSLSQRVATDHRPVHVRDEAILFISHFMWGLALAKLIRMPPREIFYDIARGLFGKSFLARRVRSFVS